MVPLSERFEMRLDEDTLSRVDAWRSEQSDLPSRAEAMRRLVEFGLARSSPASVNLSDGEKLLLIMMRDVYRVLKVKEPDLDPEFVSEVIWGGHYWALPWKLPGIFHGNRDDESSVEYVQNVLDMWNRLERGLERLPKSDRARVLKESGMTTVKFFGFDGNHEGEELGIARFLIERLDRWGRFKGRELNSHMPTSGIYSRMLTAFEPLRKLEQDDLSSDQLVSLLKSISRKN